MWAIASTPLTASSNAPSYVAETYELVSVGWMQFAVTRTDGGACEKT